MEGRWLVCGCILWHIPLRNKIGLEFMVPVRIHSVLGCTGSCVNTSKNIAFKEIIK